ncbi:hypothetical protein C8F04DRAFT_1199898 [Mycena alexandri]|uniref:Uncharacterized protein n=1 Tax=Mycena alexandri TaxID=1745969 RepID=A0AAD6RYH6_9AGAR|nr:hypothetical protein C8F04DRAFT_1199898 [Mycena alexandri]
MASSSLLPCPAFEFRHQQFAGTEGRAELRTRVVPLIGPIPLIIRVRMEGGRSCALSVWELVEGTGGTGWGVGLSCACVCTSFGSIPLVDHVRTEGRAELRTCMHVVPPSVSLHAHGAVVLRSSSASPVGGGGSSHVGGAGTQSGRGVGGWKARARTGGACVPPGGGVGAAVVGPGRGGVLGAANGNELKRGVANELRRGAGGWMERVRTCVPARRWQRRRCGDARQEHTLGAANGNESKHESRRAWVERLGVLVLVWCMVGAGGWKMHGKRGERVCIMRGLMFVHIPGAGAFIEATQMQMDIRRPPPPPSSLGRLRAGAQCLQCAPFERLALWPPAFGIAADNEEDVGTIFLAERRRECARESQRGCMTKMGTGTGNGAAS